jgi:hypothetical protein
MRRLVLFFILAGVLLFGCGEDTSLDRACECEMTCCTWDSESTCVYFRYCSADQTEECIELYPQEWLDKRKECTLPPIR